MLLTVPYSDYKTDYGDDKEVRRLGCVW